VIRILIALSILLTAVPAEAQEQNPNPDVFVYDSATVQTAEYATNPTILFDDGFPLNSRAVFYGDTVGLLFYAEAENGGRAMGIVDISIVNRSGDGSGLIQTSDTTATLVVNSRTILRARMARYDYLYDGWYDGNTMYWMEPGTDPAVPPPSDTTSYEHCLFADWEGVPWVASSQNCAEGRTTEVNNIIVSRSLGFMLAQMGDRDVFQ